MHKYREAELIRFRAMMGIRQVDISNCGLYSYAIYSRALEIYEHCPRIVCG